MTQRRYTIGAVVFDEAAQRYRKANPLFDVGQIEWAVYDYGSFSCAYPDKASALRAVKGLG